jgi:hypothetical protein
MKKFKFLKIFGLAMIVSLAVYNVGLALNIDGSNDVSLNSVETLALAETAWNPICYNGGIGSLSCSIDAGIEIASCGVSGACSVSCEDGYYACCGIRCTCKEKAKKS